MDKQSNCTINKATGMPKDQANVNPHDVEAIIKAECRQPAQYKVELNAAHKAKAQEHMIGVEEVRPVAYTCALHAERFRALPDFEVTPL